jgi:hypothetical protein
MSKIEKPKAEVFHASVAMDLKNGSADLANSKIPS